MDMDDLITALRQAAKKVGISEIARQLGWSEQTLINKLNGGSDSLKLSEVVAVLHKVDPDVPLEVLCAMFDRRVATRCKDVKPTLMSALLHALNEHNDIGLAIDAAMNDPHTPGVITASERVDILRQCAEARLAVTRIENTVAVHGVVVDFESPSRA